MTAGIPHLEIGGMTVKEIALAEQVRQEKNKEFTQSLAWIAYNAAMLTGIAVNNPKNFPKLEAAFPSLFEKEGPEDWQMIKARMEAFAASHNQKSN